MGVITLKMIVGNLDNVRRSFTHIKVHRCAIVDGTYLEITDSVSRPVLEGGKTVYTYIDETSPDNAYYKSSYFNPVSGLESSLSGAQQGEGDPALDIITVSEVKTYYLFGLDLTDDANNPYPDELYEHFIKSAVSWLEHRLHIPIRPKSIAEEKHDFIREEYQKFISIFLKCYPVIDIEEFKMVLPGEQVSQIFERDWLHIQKESGQLQVVPGTGGAGTILMGGMGGWHSLFRARGRLVPDVFRIKYTAGFESGEVPEVIKDLIGKVASFGPLNIAGDLLGGAGIASQTISADGLSTTFNTTSSATNAGYGARLLQYQKEIKEVIPTLRRYYKGNIMAVG